jgi:two-component system, NtrC family, sensor kinase
MKKALLVMAACLGSFLCNGQKINADSFQISTINFHGLDSMLRLLETKSEDTTKANLLGALSREFAFTQADTSVRLGQQGIQLSKQLEYRKGVAYCSRSLAMGLSGVGNYSNALQVGLSALHLYEDLEDRENVAYTYYVLSNIFRDFGDYKRAMEEARKGSEIYKELGAKDAVGHAIIGSIYDLQMSVDSASYYVNKALILNNQVNKEGWGWLYYLKGNIHRKKMQYDSALFYYKKALPVVRNKDIIETYNGLAILYDEIGREDSCIYYASHVLQQWRHVSYQRGILQAANILADVYKKTNQRDSAIKYFELGVALNNNMFNQQNERDIQNLAFNEKLRVDEEIRARAEYENNIKMYVLLTAGLLFMIIAALLWRNNKHRKEANVLLLQEKEKVEATLRELESTQSQLIQSAKMASLGELTAGIAHEIQNPLNFINNFSDVNTELIDELQNEMERGNLPDAKQISTTIKENEQKIIHHGKRADAIVKGMLQHSRQSSGAKEPTDINALISEYLRLSYHGFRAKDKTFNADFRTELDPTLPRPNVIPEDIGRVMLNLINNAFYAVDKKVKAGVPGYKPEVIVLTKSDNNHIEIHVNDNGHGIPDSIKEKIFQPFFTTKPTGQGTGLGLSLAYDIITKGHGGELKVETKEGEGSEFVIRLPVV